MEHYLLFLLMASLAVLSPGPGVMLTLTNSLRYGISQSLGGIAGISLGALIVALISATGLGLVLAASAVAFSILKFAGAAYLIFLGIKMWLSKPVPVNDYPPQKHGIKIRFIEGLSTQLLNPKAIFFFLSVFPQFIDSSVRYEPQFILLVLTYCVLIAIIHFLYALTAGKAKKWISSKRGARIVNRTGGTAFIFFGISLAVSKS